MPVLRVAQRNTRFAQVRIAPSTQLLTTLALWEVWRVKLLTSMPLVKWSAYPLCRVILRFAPFAHVRIAPYIPLRMIWVHLAGV